jgi:hypothetical protein
MTSARPPSHPVSNDAKLRTRRTSRFSKNDERHAATPGGGVARPGYSSGGPTSGGVRYVKSNPGRLSPNAAVVTCPGSLRPGVRASARSWDIRFPIRRRSTSTAIVPGSTVDTNIVAKLRKRCVGSSSAASIARSAIALTMPPHGKVGAFHSLPTSAW